MRGGLPTFFLHKDLLRLVEIQDLVLLEADKSLIYYL